jgi:hypothetical protein
MQAQVFVEADPVTDRACGLLDSIEALAVDALLLQRPDTEKHVYRQARLNNCVAANPRAAKPTCQSGLPSHLMVATDRLRAPALERLISRP